MKEANEDEKKQHYIILLDHLEDKASCMKKIKELSYMLHEPIELEKSTTQVIASIGYSLYSEEAADWKGLIDLADKRMYQKKESSN